MAEKQCSSSGCTKESCEGCPSKNKPTSFQVASNEYTKVKHVIGVVSGKGGVGKSMVTASLANLMAEKGYRVGILDADITGPSIPKMYGLHGPAQADDNGIYPPLAENDIKVMSINLLMPDEEAPVIWRGPVISGMVKQFWTDVIWGELDYLFVDMPPGTGDRKFSTGPCKDDRKESIPYGKKHECADPWYCGKLQLSGMSGLRKEDFCIR